MWGVREQRQVGESRNELDRVLRCSRTERPSFRSVTFTFDLEGSHSITEENEESGLSVNILDPPRPMGSPTGTSNTFHLPLLPDLHTNCFVFLQSKIMPTCY